jgi:hypothetical protein
LTCPDTSNETNRNGFINPIGVVANVRIQKLDLSIGPNSLDSTRRRRQNPIPVKSYN